MRTAPQRQDLFTAAERKLLAESGGVALAKASRDEVRDRLTRARGLRDKWRQLFGGQARRDKRSSRAVAEANARSREKADALHGAVTRLESRLAELDGEPATPAAGRRTKGKRARTAAHRTTRAGVRAALAGQTAALNHGRPPRPAAGRAKKPAAAAAQPSTAPVTSTDRATTRAAKPAAGARRGQRAPITAVAGGGSQAIRFDRSKQRSARAEAAQSRLVRKGVSTRRAGHVLASGKRAQAKRDKRSR